MDYRYSGSINTSSTLEANNNNKNKTKQNKKKQNKTKQNQKTKQNKNRLTLRYFEPRFIL